MNSIKPLLPSLKEKRRYLVYQAITETPTTLEETRQAIQEETQTFLGKLGAAKAGLVFLDDWHDQKGILRIATPAVDQIKTALFMIRKINKKEAILTTKGVSGTLNQARNKFIVH